MHPCTMPSYLTSHTNILGPGIPLARVADPDPVGSGDIAWIRIRFSNLSCSGSESGFQISLDPDPVCYKRLDPDPVNIRPDPEPCS